MWYVFTRAGDQWQAHTRAPSRNSDVWERLAGWSVARYETRDGARRAARRIGERDKCDAGIATAPDGKAGWERVR